MNSRRRLVFLLANIACVLLLVDGEYRDPESLCASQKHCDKCLQTPQCVWCSMLTSSQTKPLIRCVTKDKYFLEGDSWCLEYFVIDDNNMMKLLKNDPLSSGINTVQVQPQKMKLRLRKGEEYRLTLKYSQAVDYPVDLYYLMDLSASMEPYRDSLSELGLSIATAMMKLTSNFRLGFGSFVDKVVLPMTSTMPQRLKRPCQLSRSRKPCAPPYGFKNQMPLTEDITLFQSNVMKAPISGNLDAPEGGLDALMQAMVCTKKINWRPNARHLIVFSTDAGFHQAGDGKLAGIVEPNDCLCHLDEEGFYNHSKLQDYPSISQISKKSQEHNMNIIFALAQGKNHLNYEASATYKTYKEFTEVINGWSLGVIKGDSSSIVALISEEYKKLVNSVRLVDNRPNLIDVKYYSRCLNVSGDLTERQECGGIRVGNVVEFEIFLKALECPTNREEWKQRLQIKPEGINEDLSIEIDIICDCNCQTNEQLESKECNGHGRLKCGVCICDKGYYKERCQCKGDTFEFNGSNITADCKLNKMDSKDCSDRGTCICGACECNKRPNPQEIFYGPYCECDNFSCKRSNGLLCGGNGKCECHKCNCWSGWSGEACDCKESNSTCMPSMMANFEGDVELCSGRGDCICGTCKCHEKDNILYSGRYCEECPTCPGQKCEELKNCVECKAYGTGPYAKDDKCESCILDLTKVDVIERDPNDYHGTICRTPGDEGCTFVFRYEHAGRGDIKIYTVYAQKERECPMPVNILGIALGVVLSTIFLGLLIILIWKILTMIHDKREYEKFEAERAKASWERGDNPLYKEATSTFQNPTFKDNGQDASASDI